MARRYIHVSANETRIFIQQFISLGSMASPSVSKKTGIDMSDILSYNLKVLQHIVFKKNHCIKPEFDEILSKGG